MMTYIVNYSDIQWDVNLHICAHVCRGVGNKNGLVLCHLIIMTNIKAHISHVMTGVLEADKGYDQQSMGISGY